MQKLERQIKHLLKKQEAWRQSYYGYLAHQSFLELTLAEDLFDSREFPACAVAVFRSAEFFWKALTILTPGGSFHKIHEADTKAIMNISDDLLTTSEKSKIVAPILTQFSNIRRELATYGTYQPGKTGVPPSQIFTKSDVESDLKHVRELSQFLKRVHFFQNSEPPIEIGVLSGYIDGPDGEISCTYRPYAGYRQPDGWVADLKETNSSPTLFSPRLVHISELIGGHIPVVINPFGEAIPEKKSGRNIGFDTIRQYVRNGGIFINVAGQPFVYGWDVTEGKEEIMVQPVRSSIGLRLGSESGQPAVYLAESFSFKPLADFLRKTFRFETVWDRYPTATGPTGPQELSVTSKSDGEPKTLKANVFRPVRPGNNIVPLLEAETENWGKVYPAAAINHGRGVLLSFGLSLDGEREYSIVREIIRQIAVDGFLTFA